MSAINPFVETRFDSFRLAADAGAGATSIEVDSAPSGLASNANRPIVIDPFTTEAELRQVASVSGTTLGVAALTYAHSKGDELIFTGHHSERLIPLSWWGANGNNVSATATDNVTAFNRLSESIHTNGGVAGIYLDGIFCVNDELQMYESQALIGTHVFSSRINAVSGFPFDGTGQVAIIHCRRGANPAVYDGGSDSGRWWMRNIYVDGQNLANANGILFSPQQPDATENIRVNSCPGYGMALGDSQYHHMSNIQFDNCGVALHVWDMQFLRVYNMNITTGGTLGIDFKNVGSSSIWGGLLEGVSGDKLIYCHSGSSGLGFHGLFTSGVADPGTMFYFDNSAGGGPGNKADYIITQCYYNHNSTTCNFVYDAQRNISFNTFGDANRQVMFGYAAEDSYEFQLSNRRISSGPAQIGGTLTAGSVSGPTLQSGSAAPEGAVPGVKGSLYLRTGGGTGTCLYVKENDGVGNELTGWVPK